MDWNTLVSVVIGGLIATIGSILNNRFQAKQQERDRQEQRREAKTELALELKRNDVKIVEETIDGYLKGLGELRSIRVKYPDTEKAKDAMQAEYVSRIGEEDSFFSL